MSPKITSRIHGCIIIRQRLGRRDSFPNSRSVFANKRNPKIKIRCF